MKEARFTIKGRFPSLNEYIGAERSNRYKAAAMKRDYQSIAAAAIKEQVHDVFGNPVHIHYTFFEPNRKRDCDNVFSFASKVIQDALVSCGVIQNDSPRYVDGFSARFAYLDSVKDSEIVVTITDYSTYEQS